MNDEPEKSPRNIPETPEASLPIVAATLAAALLSRGKPEENSAKDAGAAVRQYRQLLGKLARGLRGDDEDQHKDE